MNNAISLFVEENDKMVLFTVILVKKHETRLSSEIVQEYLDWAGLSFNKISYHWTKAVNMYSEKDRLPFAKNDSNPQLNNSSEVDDPYDPYR